MKGRLLSGITVAVLGAMIILVPVCIFPTCSGVIETAAGGTVPMKCFWSGRAEIGIGLLILCSGILFILVKSPLIRIGVSIMTALSGFVGILIPTLLIGGCEMMTMSCRMTSFPAVIVLSVLTIVVSIANSIYLWKKDKKLQGKTDGQ
ncbi:DUF4418 family protein [Clostridium aminobutyricum]|uniref:DUF4418 family protein n=1 Tax=Clostridium aminobutyricum TaxID=33953 RepID=A0A939D8X9_CLOAM|nr:DUF4418 family protein [Clostridium aminobutyricum]MBN7773242.1 DUF4418 family protein [Clostridium aminobutyricum]